MVGCTEKPEKHHRSNHTDLKRGTNLAQLELKLCQNDQHTITKKNAKSYTSSTVQSYWLQLIIGEILFVIIGCCHGEWRLVL